ncbi:MAG: hypothetical protein J6P07_07240, partial [Spirochaetaceae bacterium]|nr:hypothetical protein [Spirochaetaceae bacterium]
MSIVKQILYIYMEVFYPLFAVDFCGKLLSHVRRTARMADHEAERECTYFCAYFSVSVSAELSQTMEYERVNSSFSTSDMNFAFIDSILASLFSTDVPAKRTSLFRGAYTVLISELARYG